MAPAAMVELFRKILVVDRSVAKKPDGQRSGTFSECGERYPRQFLEPHLPDVE